MKIVKYLLLFLAINFDINVKAQGVVVAFDLSSIDECNLIVDSLERINYFDKCLQVNPNKAISEFYMYINYGEGCYARSDEYYELVYKGYKGYLVKSTRAGNGSYTAIIDIKTIAELVDRLNKTYAFDNALLINDSLAHNSFGAGYGNLKINLKFVDGEIIKRDYNFGSIRNYCVFLPELFKYYTDLFNRSFKPLDSSIASKLLIDYNSEIALNFLYDFQLGLPRLTPKGITLDEYIIPMWNNKKSGKH